MIKPISLLICVVIVAACSTIDKNIPISHVNVLNQGQNYKNRPEMASVCKGFILTGKQVSDFYYNASLVSEKVLSKKYEILPCYTTGTAYIFGEKYSWIIRSGGVGEFYNDKNRFINVCGKKCCKKVTGIC